MDLYAYRRASIASEDAHMEAAQRLQENVFTLQTKAQALQDQKMRSEAIKKYDPAKPETLDLVAKDLAQGGDYAGSLEVETQKNGMLAAKQKVQMDQIKMIGDRAELAGGILGTMGASPEAYNSGMMRLMAAGVDTYDMGLTEGYEGDKGKLPALALSSMTAYQQATLAEKTEDNKRKVDVESRQVDALQARVKHEIATEANAEARTTAYEKAQENIATRQRLQQEGKALAAKIKIQKAAEPTVVQRGQAAEILKADKRTKEATEGIRGVWKNMLASRTSAAIAQHMVDGTSDGGPDDYDAEMQRQLDGMIEDGSIRFEKHWYKKDTGLLPSDSTPEKAKGASPAPRKGPETGGKLKEPEVVDPKKIPMGGFLPLKSGKRYKRIGTGADGYPTFETNPDGSPKEY